MKIVTYGSVCLMEIVSPKELWTCFLSDYLQKPHTPYLHSKNSDLLFNCFCLSFQYVKQSVEQSSIE